jgi:hypothetical protein
MSTFLTKRAKELGLKKVDGKEPLTLKVSKLDVLRATRKNSKCCAFARACKRQVDVTAAYFFRSTAWLEYPDKLVKYDLPPSVQKEIVSFDRAGIVASGTYHLRPPTPSTSLKAIAKWNKSRGKRTSQPTRPGAKKRPMHRTELIRNTLEPADVAEGGGR